MKEDKVILSFCLKNIFVSVVFYLANQGVVDVFDGRAVQPRLLFQPGSRAEAIGICSKVPTHEYKIKVLLVPASLTERAHCGARREEG